MCQSTHSSQQRSLLLSAVADVEKAEPKSTVISDILRQRHISEILETISGFISSILGLSQVVGYLHVGDRSTFQVECDNTSPS